MPNLNKYVFPEEVMEVTGLGKTSSYNLIKEMNAELNELGYVTFSGRVDRKFFFEKTACKETSENNVIPNYLISKRFLRVEDVMCDCGICMNDAYKLISKLNKELSEKGFYVCCGRVVSSYYIERTYYKASTSKTEKVA